MSELSTFLHHHGYQRVPLARSAVGHFHTKGSLNGRQVELLVDTGASCTCVSMSLVEELGLAFSNVDIAGGGAGGALDQFLIEGAILEVGPVVPRLGQLVGMDFGSINEHLQAHGSSEVDMILGVDVFDGHQAVIDFATQSLYLKADLDGSEGQP